MTDTNKPLLGFVGQGYIGKNYADECESRGFTCVRYALEEPYVANKEKIAQCDIVFVGVPTPTTPTGFDDSIVRSAVELVGRGKVAVIKSTITPGTTCAIQEAYPDRIVLYSPEFLSEATAAYDVAHPYANVAGYPVPDEAHKDAAARLLAILPESPVSLACTSTEAEIIKYTHNGSGYTQIIFFNLMYDLAQALGADWANIQKVIANDPFICNRYANPVHKSGRGAGGHCFIKDFAALRERYETVVGPHEGAAFMRAAEEANKALLRTSGKDLDLLEGVYGKT